MPHCLCLFLWLISQTLFIDRMLALLGLGPYMRLKCYIQSRPIYNCYYGAVDKPTDRARNLLLSV